VAGIAYIQYSSTQAAAYAKQKLDGFEYPPGYRVAVRFYRGGQGDHVWVMLFLLVVVVIDIETKETLSQKTQLHSL